MKHNLLLLGVALLVSLQNPVSQADILAIDPYNLLTDGGKTGYGSLFAGRNQFATELVDTYGAEPLAQDVGGAFYISSGGGAFPTFSFDGIDELHGNSLTGVTGDTFIVREASTDLGGGQFLIQAEVIALNAAGSRTDWVASGVTSPNGFFTSWRVDVGGVAAAADLIDPGSNFTLINSGFEVFNLAGASLGAFGLSLDLSDSTGLGGVGVVGLGGANIAGFGVSSMQVFFTVELVSIPEPSGIALISLAGCCLGLRRRKKV